METIDQSFFPPAFCWNKMGTEAGEPLKRIVKRKEVERLANNGVFAWGVGNSLGSSILALLQEHRNPQVVFTHMRSKPKSIDAKPKRILLWLSYFDANGIEKPLPMYTLLTSRGDTYFNRQKRNHYALLCQTHSSLFASKQGELDGSRLVNYLSGRHVGASQVTSVVKVVSPVSRKPQIYRLGFVAKLVWEGQVKLASYVEIEPKDLAPIIEVAEYSDVEEWKMAINKLKEKYVWKCSPSESLMQHRD